jgi:hypothetical protein
LDFIANADIARGVPFDVHFVNEPLRLEEYPVGEYTLYLAMNGAAFEVKLDVEDTTPPAATTINKAIPMGDEVTLDDFLVEIYDASPIAAIEFITEPDIFSVGDQILEIAIEDDFGNRGVFKTILTVLHNDVPPVIDGTHTIESMRGNTIMYRQGVSAYDAFGRPLELIIDSSNVDQNREGMYTVTYRAVDTEWVNERVDAVLAQILSEGMTQVEQTRAIFTWIRRNMSFAAASAAPRSAYEGAYRALRDRLGGCTIYSSLSHIMLTRAGIPNLRIERIPEAPSRHRWNLVNPDDLGWHHFDAFPIRLGGLREYFYMFTDSQAQDFARQLYAAIELPYYFTYNPELYPEVVP